MIAYKALGYSGVWSAALFKTNNYSTSQYIYSPQLERIQAKSTEDENAKCLTVCLFRSVSASRDRNRDYPKVRIKGPLHMCSPE